MPEPWESGESGPFLTIGEVSVWALGEDRYRVEAPDDQREVEGFERARQLAHELAGV